MELVQCSSCNDFTINPNHLCPRCSFLSIGLGTNKYELKVLLARFIEYHTRAWNTKINQDNLGTTLIKTPKSFYLKICSHEKLVYDFLKTFWYQFSLFTIIGNRKITPIWNKTFENDWYEGTELFYDWFLQFKERDKKLKIIQVNEDVIKESITKLFVKLWNFDFKPHRKLVMEKYYSTPDDDKKAAFIDELIHCGQINLSDQKTWKKILDGNTSHEERQQLRKQVNLCHDQWDTPMELIQGVVSKLVNDGKISKKNVGIIIKILYERWQLGKFQVPNH